MTQGLGGRVVAGIPADILKDIRVTPAGAKPLSTRGSATIYTRDIAAERAEEDEERPQLHKSLSHTRAPSDPTASIIPNLVLDYALESSLVINTQWPEPSWQAVIDAVTAVPERYGAITIVSLVLDE